MLFRSATAAELTGATIPPNAGEDSVSLVPALLGKSDASTRDGTIHQSAAGDLALRQGPWKLIFHKNGQRELFNLQADLSETKDVAESNRDIVERLTTLMRGYISEGRSTLGAPQKNDAEMSINDSANNKQKPTKKAGKKAEKKAGKEVALALDPSFD